MILLLKNRDCISLITLLKLTSISYQKICNIKVFHVSALLNTQFKEGKYKIVMVRHGESEWNKLNLFCGWYNAELSERGRNEAFKAGQALKDAGYKFDAAYTSVLKRANDTLDGILKELGQENIPINKTWRLNERHYGGLTGNILIEQL